MKKDRPCSKILKIIHIGDVVIAIYDWLLIKLLSPFNPKAKQWINGRKDFYKNLPEISNETIPGFNKVGRKHFIIFLFITTAVVIKVLSIRHDFSG